MNSLADGSLALTRVSRITGFQISFSILRSRLFLDFIEVTFGIYACRISRNVSAERERVQRQGDGN